MLTQTMGTVGTGLQRSMIKLAVTIDVMLCNTVASGIVRSRHQRMNTMTKGQRRSSRFYKISWITGYYEDTEIINDII